MMTPAERKALLFVCALLSLGGAVRIVRALQTNPSPPRVAADSVAIAEQIQAVDSARATHGSNRPRAVGVVVTPPTQPPAFERMPVERRYSARAERIGRPPSVYSGRAAYSSRVTTTAGPVAPVDLDQATALEIERLPRIGPALAKRLVEERERGGPFGSMAGLRRVKGIGPAMVQVLEPLVTFSGVGRMR